MWTFGMWIMFSSGEAINVVAFCGWIDLEEDVTEVLGEDVSGFVVVDD